MRRGLWPVGVVGAVLAAAYVVLVIGTSNWDPTVMLAEGVEAPRQLEYAERVLQTPVATRPALGHDGKFFFILANDPLLLDPQNHGAYLDLPTYRAQRILYPLLAGGFGLFSASTTVWALIAVNVLAAGLGAFATGGIARLLGTSRWLGLLFVINPGVIAELDINGGGVVAMALALVGLLLLVNDHSNWALVALLGAGLARETMLLLIGALFLWWWRRKDHFRPALVVVPTVAVVGWRLYSGFRLSAVESGASAAEGFFRSFDPIPLRGIAEASAGWIQDPSKFVWMVALVGLLILFVRRAWRSPAGIGWSAWPFAVLSVFLSVLVWLEPYDIARAVAPVFIAYPLILFAKVPIEESKSK